MGLVSHARVHARPMLFYLPSGRSMFQSYKDAAVADFAKRKALEACIPKSGTSLLSIEQCPWYICFKSHSFRHAMQRSMCFHQLPHVRTLRGDHDCVSSQATQPQRVANIVDRTNRLRTQVHSAYPAWTPEVVDLAVGVLVVYLSAPLRMLHRGPRDPSDRHHRQA